MEDRVDGRQDNISRFSSRGGMIGNPSQNPNPMNSGVTMLINDQCSVYAASPTSDTKPPKRQDNNDAFRRISNRELARRSRQRRLALLGREGVEYLRQIRRLKRKWKKIMRACKTKKYVVRRQCGPVRVLPSDRKDDDEWKGGTTPLSILVA